ncbi:MAG: RsmD family RNA methyltransferase, partial [Actinomycetia bacterium]|nr:RsmD family RNA methyltransferase [Actinomycetes bacterium]
MVKVTGGEARGHILYVPRGLKIRPTAGRVRESLFNILNEYITEADILDLFAGIGLLGIESLSRGARRATFVDKSKISLRYLRRNLEKTKLSNKSEIIKDDIRKALENLKNKK